jgi:hypothetical protein
MNIRYLLFSLAACSAIEAVDETDSPTVGSTSGASTGAPEVTTGRPTTTGDESTTDGGVGTGGETTGATTTTGETAGETTADAETGGTTTDGTTNAATDGTTMDTMDGTTTDAETTGGTETETDTGVAEQVALVRIGRYAQPDPAAAIAVYLDIGLGAAEIPAFDPASMRLFVVNGQKSGVDVLDLTDPSAPALLTTLVTSGSPNSVAVRDGLVAVAVAAAVKTEPGEVWFFDAASGEKLAAVGVGALPDMIAFSPDGRYVVTADEGEPDSDYLVDPPGTISIIDVSGKPQNLTPADVKTADFSGYTLVNLDPDVRLFGPSSSEPALDLEPEYVAIAGDSKTAYVTLQENNAIAVVDLDAGAVTDVRALGFKDWSAGPKLDPSDKDGAAALVDAPVLGMYQPDATAWFSIGGVDYLLTANEGDTRDWDGYSEEARVKGVDLDPEAFPDAAALQKDAALGRLKVTTALGDTDLDGDLDVLYTFGGRSFSVWSAADGALVHDSGDRIEQRIATDPGFSAHFNAGNDDNDFDTRSDDKGPEPEGLTLGVAYGRTLGFVGLERMGGVLMLDLAEPSDPEILAYVNPRDFAGDPLDGSADDLGPEGLTFVRADDSPSGRPLVIVANEVSGTVSIYEILAE